MGLAVRVRGACGSWWHGRGVVRVGVGRCVRELVAWCDGVWAVCVGRAVGWWRKINFK